MGGDPINLRSAQVPDLHVRGFSSLRRIHRSTWYYLMLKSSDNI